MDLELEEGFKEVMKGLEEAVKEREKEVEGEEVAEKVVEEREGEVEEPEEEVEERVKEEGEEEVAKESEGAVEVRPLWVKYPRQERDFLGRFESRMEAVLGNYEVVLLDTILQMESMVQGARRIKEAEELRDLMRKNMEVLWGEFKEGVREMREHYDEE